MRPKIIIFAFAVVLIAVGVFLWERQNPHDDARDGVAVLRLERGPIVRLEIADTPEERERGLSGRESLEEGTGMIFLFNQPDRMWFWMKEMKFPLDFIWMNGNVIVDLTADVPPPGPRESPVRVHPVTEVDRVIEVSAGFIAQTDLKIGDRLVLDGVGEK